jgi:hypothetical protein
MQHLKELNKQEYWFVDLVCMGSFPLHLLTHPDLELIANRDSHGLLHPELLDTLYKLFQEGSLIGVQSPNDESLIRFLPTYQEIDAALQSQNTTQYELTSKGGTQWEALSNPSWTRFVGGSCFPSEHLAILEASFCPTSEEEIQLFHYFYDCEVVPESIECERLSPWKALYWKTLPYGYKLSTQLIKSPNRFQGDISSEEQKFIEKILNWYTNPFKSPY